MSSAHDPDLPHRPRSAFWYGVSAACLAVAVVIAWGVTRADNPGPAFKEPPSSAPVASSDTATAPVRSPTSTALASAAIEPVAPGEITRFRAERNGQTFIDAASSGVATYGKSPACDVPEYPCYVPPFLDKVARMDVGAVPSVPSTNTCYVTGHSNWRNPQDPSAGVFSELQTTQVGDTFVVTTTDGTFVYTVTRTIPSLPFDQLRSNVDVKAVRPNTCVVISCHIDGRGYSGNFVAFAELTASKPT